MAQGIMIPDVDLIDNTSQRLPCVLVLDGSSSMSGTPIDELNAGLRVLEQELKSDATASQRVQLLVIRLGGKNEVDVMVDWTDAMSFNAPRIDANGSTPLGSAVQLAMSKLEEQKARYRANGIPYNRPWMFVITDGAPTDDWNAVASACKTAESRGQLTFFGIGVGAADLATLGQFSARSPLRMKDGIKFKELFIWMSRSATSASKAAQGTTTQLASPSDWAQIPT
jgi:uncharacterized protein YegL